MRSWMRAPLILVACAVTAVGAAEGAKKTDKKGRSKAAKQTAVEKEAEAFLATITSLLKPVATRATMADWTSLTDVTPEHTGQRVGADGALATLAGSPLIIEKSKAFLAQRDQLDDQTARQLQKLL